MNKPDGPAYAIIGAIALTQLFFALTLAIFPGWPKVGEWLNNEAAATWFQAVVSIIAIGAGAGAIYWQVGRQAQIEAERAKADHVRKLQTLKYALFMLRLQIVMLEETLSRSLPATRQLPSIERAADRLLSVPLMEIPSWDATHAVSTAISAVDVLKFRLNEMNGLINAVVLQPVHMHYVDEALNFVADAEVGIAKELADLGSHSPALSVEIAGRVHHCGVAPEQPANKI